MGELLGTSEAARRLGVHPFTLRRWEESGKLLPDYRDSTKKRLYFAETVEAFRRQREDHRQAGVK